MSTGGPASLPHNYVHCSNMNFLKDVREIRKMVTYIKSTLKLKLLKFQKRSGDFSGFPTGSGGFYFPENLIFYTSAL